MNLSLGYMHQVSRKTIWMILQNNELKPRRKDRGSLL